MRHDLKSHHTSARSKGMALGLILVVLGGILLAVNFGYLSAGIKTVIFSWPMIFVVIGIFQIFHRHYFSSFIMFAIGAFFLLPKIATTFPELFPGIGSNFATVYWPILLIVAGLFFLLSLVFPKKWTKCCSHWDQKENFVFERNGNDLYDKNVVFGNVEHIFLDEEFPGGEINAVFGGVTLDLRKTKLAEGDTLLEVNAVFGGITLYVPGDWYVITKFDSVMGGFEDKRRIQEPIDKTKKLIIKGSCVFGGGEIL